MGGRRTERAARRDGAQYGMHATRVQRWFGARVHTRMRAMRAVRADYADEMGLHIASFLRQKCAWHGRNARAGSDVGGVCAPRARWSFGFLSVLFWSFVYGTLVLCWCFVVGFFMVRSSFIFTACNFRYI